MEQSSLDSGISDMSNLTTTAKDRSNSAFLTDSLTTPLSSAMSEHSLLKGTPQAIREWLMSLPQDSPANPLALPENKKGPKTSATCGLQPSHAFASYDHAMRSWRTSQACLLTPTFSEFSETWPSAGIMRNGVVWGGTKPEALRTAKDFGLSLLRPTAQCWKAWTFLRILSLVRKNHADGNIQEQSARCFHKMITPESNEILMMWPQGWTDLKPLATDRYQDWLQQHGGYYHNDP